MSNNFSEDNNLPQQIEESLKDSEITNESSKDSQDIFQEIIDKFLNNFHEELKAFEEKLRQLEKLNIIISGKPGVGKSTLINSVFGFSLSDERRARTGEGKPVTTFIDSYTNPDISYLEIIDTPGLELGKLTENLNALEDYIKNRNNNTNPDNHIHVAWYCILESNYRVEDAEIKLVEMLSQYMPVIVIITRAKQDKQVQIDHKTGQPFVSPSFKSTVEKEMSFAKSIVRVMAQPEFGVDDSGNLSIKSPQIGLNELIDETLKVLPEARQKSFRYAQIVDVSERTAKAMKFMSAAVITAFAAGAVPHNVLPPGSHAAGLIVIQTGMFVSISIAFRLPIKEGTLSTIVTSVAGAGIATAVGRELFQRVLELSPLLPVSLAASALIAASGTVIMGLAYIETLKFILHNNLEITEENIKRILNEQLNKIKNLKPIIKWIKDNKAYPKSLAKFIDVIDGIIDKIDQFKF